ncbi:MAG: RagB/SusD family nutrient uptake outer membrane protein, partial [Bacteroidales bacterium]|nr:RagB/SusD family nutrient uptake outer membrane protein [Bacteroidales bacterium]
MKKIILLTSVVLFAAMLQNCEDFLEKAPLDTISTDSELNETDAVALVNAAYQPLQWAKLYNMRIWTTDIVAGNSYVGADGASDGIETTDLANFTASSSNMAALDVWRGPNPGILRCNIVLSKVPEIPMDDALRQRVLGEAYFLRAHYYFILVRLFGDVPLITQPLVAGDNLARPRNPKSEVYDLIVDDCKKAIEMLPVKAS